MADRRHFEKPLNRYISATVWPILLKFGTVKQIEPYRGQTVKISNFSKNQDGGKRKLENHKNRDISSKSKMAYGRYFENR